MHQFGSKVIERVRVNDLADSCAGITYSVPSFFHSSKTFA